MALEMALETATEMATEMATEWSWGGRVATVGAAVGRELLR
jgi:hypothetical protein